MHLGKNPKYIKENAKIQWKNMDIKKKKLYKLQKKENDTIFDLAFKYKHLNPFILFVYDKLEYFKKNNLKIPSINDLIKSWKKLNNSEKNNYEVYFNELLVDKYKIRDIYDAIHGIKPKTPAGALRIFLQFQVKTKKINF